MSIESPLDQLLLQVVASELLGDVPMRRQRLLYNLLEVHFELWVLL